MNWNLKYAENALSEAMRNLNEGLKNHDDTDAYSHLNLSDLYHKAYKQLIRKDRGVKTPENKNLYKKHKIHLEIGNQMLSDESEMFGFDKQITPSIPEAEQPHNLY